MKYWAKVRLITGFSGISVYWGVIPSNDKGYLMVNC